MTHSGLRILIPVFDTPVHVFLLHMYIGISCWATENVYFTSVENSKLLKVIKIIYTPTNNVG